jgi:hypothetical protein
MMNKLILIVLALTFGQFIFAQDTLPVLKASSKLVHIRDGLHFKKGHWYMTPNENPDYYYVEIPTKEHRVTFISDIDSISFDVKYGREYDFIILVSNKESFRRRVSATYKNLDHFVRKRVKPGPDTLSFALGDNDKVYLKGMVNGSQPLDIQFDLGAGGTLIKKGSLEKVKMELDKSITLQNSDGTNQVPMASRNRLEMGNMVWDSVSIAVADNMTHREDLIVGNSLFKNKILEIDYDKGIVVIHDTLSTIDDSYSRHDIVLDGGTVPFIEGSLNFRGKTQKGWMMVDLGAYTSIFNTADVPATNKMLGEAKKMIGLNNSYFVPNLTIGNYKFSGFNYSTQKLNGDGLQVILGNDLLKRFNFVLDNRNGHLYLKPNSLTQKSYRNPEYIVVRVAAGLLIFLLVILAYWKRRKYSKK